MKSKINLIAAIVLIPVIGVVFYLLFAEILRPHPAVEPNAKQLANPVDQLEIKRDPRFFGEQVSNPFPPIRDLQIISAEKANATIPPNELVIGVTINGESRAYTTANLGGPSREVFNDRLGETDVLVSWCFLCFAGIVYDRNVNGEILTFYVSGQVDQQNLVMADVETGNLWTQLRGLAMMGPSTGTELKQLPSELVDWQTWVSRHPDTTVGYYENLDIGAENVQRQMGKNLVLGTRTISPPRAWSFGYLMANPVINDSVDNTPIVIWFDTDKSGSIWVYERMLNGRELSFKSTDGRMVDDQTGTEWERNSGKAISGELSGEVLKPYPLAVSFEHAFKSMHPDGKIQRPDPMPHP